MKYIIESLKKKEAEIISEWHYEEPYSLYDLGCNKEAMKELLTEPYYAMKNEKEEIIGFFCFGLAARVPAGKQYDVYREGNLTDIGLGMRPDLTGKGKGFDFLLQGLEFARKEFHAIHFRLTVATFNQRAIKVYQRAGFKEKRIFKVPHSWKQKNEMEFMIMELNEKASNIPEP